MSCKVGDAKIGADYCVEGFKYFFVAFVLEFIGILDGFWNCGNFVMRCYKSGCTSFHDIALKDAHFLADKVK